jgi:drug/metabolite transporter (DMT)-like permease
VEKSVQSSEEMRLGYICLFSRLLISAFVYFPLGKMLKKVYGMDAKDIAFFGGIIGAAFLLLTYPIKEKLYGKTPKNYSGFLPTFFASLIGGALCTLFYNEANALLPQGQVSVTYYTYPVFLFLFGTILIDRDVKKLISPKMLAGITLCLGGIFFTNYDEILHPAKIANPEGYKFVVFAIICMVLFNLITKRYKISTYPYLLTTQLLSVVIAVVDYIGKAKGVAGGFGGLVASKLAKFDFWLVVTFLVIGIVINCLREFLKFKTIDFLPISVLTTWNYFSPLTNVIANFVFAGSIFGVAFSAAKPGRWSFLTPWDLLGCALVIGGNVVASYKKKKPQAQVPVAA